MSGPLPTELKFRENAASIVYKTLLKDVEVSVRVSLWIYQQLFLINKIFFITIIMLSLHYLYLFNSMIDY